LCTNINRSEKPSDLNDWRAAKTFAVLRSGSFRRIRPSQIGPIHFCNPKLILSAFEVFAAVAGLQ
jgi:hypothetical protein